MLSSLALLAGLASFCVEAKPTVTTKNGQIVGTETDLAKVFRGIPYAAPPTNANRWKSPLPAANWAPNPLNAFEDGAACPQVSATIAVELKLHLRTI